MRLILCYWYAGNYQVNQLSLKCSGVVVLNNLTFISWSGSQDQLAVTVEMKLPALGFANFLNFLFPERLTT